MTLQEAQERVERGALLLDATHPGWYRKVQVSALELESKCACVLGQVLGNFDSWCEVIPANQKPWHYGFDIHLRDGLSGRPFKFLQDCWIAVIADRVVAEQLRDVAQDAEVTAG